MVKAILDRGAAMGEFREGIDPVQLNITIAAIGYYYLTNRFTGSIIYDRDLMAPDNLDQRLAFNVAGQGKPVGALVGEDRGACRPAECFRPEFRLVDRVAQERERALQSLRAKYPQYRGEMLQEDAALLRITPERITAWGDI